jgi:hypothetical protein
VVESDLRGAEGSIKSALLRFTKPFHSKSWGTRCAVLVMSPYFTGVSYYCRRILCKTYHELGMVSLLADDLIELVETMLHCAQNVCLKLSEAVLNLNHILSIRILLLNLLVEAVFDTPLDNVWILMCANLAACRVERCRVLCEQLDVFLCGSASLVDSLSTLASSFHQFLILRFDFSVKALKDRQDSPLEDFGSFSMGV